MIPDSGERLPWKTQEVLDLHIHMCRWEQSLSERMMR